MKRTLITMALFAVLSTLAVSCQKENVAEPHVSIANYSEIRNVSYILDNKTHHITLNNDNEWEAFIGWVMSMAENGFSISFTNEGAASLSTATKDVQTFSTRDKEAAEKWAKERADEGYTVTINYEDGVYTCIAIR